MTRKSVSLSVIIAAVWATQVAAQTAGIGGTATTVAGSGLTGSSSTTSGGNVQVQLIKAGGVEYPAPLMPSSIPISKAACEQGTITVTLSGLPNASQYPYLQVWLQRSMTIDCNTADRNTTIQANSTCLRLPLNGDDGQLKNKTYYTIDVPIGPTGPVCESSGDKTLYFLAMTSENNNDAAMYYGKMTIQVDLDPPNAPTNVVGGTGETQIELRWDLPAPPPVYVWTFVDINAVEGDVDGGTAGCSSTVLRPGMELQVDGIVPEGIIRSKVSTLRMKEVFNGESWGTKLAAAAVVAGDKAGNPSKLSELGCMRVVKTSGFWDRYQENGGTADSGWGCAIGRPQGSRRAAETALPALFILGVWAARRRLRRRAR